MSKRITKHIMHLYDHCPYCIRVELAMGLTKKPYTRTLYGYGDRLGDESKKANTYDGGVTLTGKKELPVMEEISGDERRWLKNESLDIMAWIREHTPEDQRWRDSSEREDLKTFFDSKGRFKEVQRLLTRPRILHMTHLKDWARQEDRAYAKAKYESQGFDYAAAVACDTESKAEMKNMLAALEPMLQSETSFYPGGSNNHWSQSPSSLPDPDPNHVVACARWSTRRGRPALSAGASHLVDGQGPGVAAEDQELCRGGPC